MLLKKCAVRAEREVQTSLAKKQALCCPLSPDLLLSQSWSSYTSLRSSKVHVPAFLLDVQIPPPGSDRKLWGGRVSWFGRNWRRTSMLHHNWDGMTLSYAHSKWEPSCGDLRKVSDFPGCPRNCLLPLQLKMPAVRDQDRKEHPCLSKPWWIWNSRNRAHSSKHEEGGFTEAIHGVTSIQINNKAKKLGLWN